MSRPDIKWIYNLLGSNPNITWDIVQANPSGINGSGWNYNWLSANPNIASGAGWDIVRDNPDKPWNYSYLSQNEMYKYFKVQDYIFK